MNEEKVTKCILEWLINRNWDIVCFDFPQSGTGRFLHPDNSSEKNKGAINPDIVAVKNGLCLFFENKDRYYHPDYLKQNELITDNHYMNDINGLLRDYSITEIHYGIGLPTEAYTGNAIENAHLVDFIIGVNSDYQVNILYSDGSFKF